MVALEKLLRVSIADALNRPSRKPLCWGGLAGYRQLEVLAQELQRISVAFGGEYLHKLLTQVERALAHNRTLAEDLREAHTWVQRIAACLRYPPSAQASEQAALSGEQVAAEMAGLWQQFQPDLKRRPAQRALYCTWRRLWRSWGGELLHCYDIPGLPPDNLQLESLFGQLRRQQRRVSGRKSTAELRYFGHCQVLFRAESEEALLGQLREVKLADYQVQRRRLAAAEAPRQFICRLHRDPAKTVRRLVDRYAARRAELAHTSMANCHTA